MTEFLGKILHVDLNNKTSWTEEVPSEKWIKYLPSRGLNAKLLWELTDENTEPLSKDNVLIFGVGGFTGTTAPSSGRTTVTFKSPATNMYFKSNSGGHWGAELKFAGYGNLVIHGKADKPIYLYIDNDGVEFKDAEKLWGENVRKTNDLIRKELGNEEVQTVTIGQAGEKLARISALMISTYNAAARGGGGAVMGSKNLKSIVVKGSQGIEVENTERFHELSLKAQENVMNDSGYNGLSNYGTASSTNPLNEMYARPTKNFQKCYFEDHEEISGEAMAEKGKLKRTAACYSCVIGCHRYTEVDSDKYKAYTGGPELETIGAFGEGAENNDIDSIIKANELCNIYGLDTISTGAVIQWAIESFEKGVINKEDTGGLELSWGNGEAIVKMVEKIAFREDIGDILAEGAKRAAEKIGQDSYKWAIEAKGLEQSTVDTRAAKAYGLAFAVNPRGPDHLHTQTLSELGMSKEARELIKEITGEDEFIDSTKIKKRAPIVRWHEDVYAISDALGLCSFVTTALLGVTPEIMADMWSAALDKEVSKEELMKAGKRIVTLEKAYNVRCGATREDDRLPWRLMNEKAENRPDGEVLTNTKKELDKMLDKYYKLHGWDIDTSWPTKQTLKNLDLDFVAEEFETKNKLP
ncbi:MAG: aldehyde ferredoxin oxidoreductase family protein [Bacillota bacterium]